MRTKVSEMRGGCSVNVLSGCFEVGNDVPATWGGCSVNVLRGCFEVRKDAPARLRGCSVNVRRTLLSDGQGCVLANKHPPHVYEASSPRLRNLLPRVSGASVLRTFTDHSPHITGTSLPTSKHPFSTFADHAPRISKTFFRPSRKHPAPCLTSVLRAFTEHPPHVAGTSFPTSKHTLSTLTEHPPRISETFLPRVSGASFTMSDKRPPHVYGAFSPHHRNITPHFETSPQHVYGASAPHLNHV